MEIVSMFSSVKLGWPSGCTAHYPVDILPERSGIKDVHLMPTRPRGAKLTRGTCLHNPKVNRSRRSPSDFYIFFPCLSRPMASR